METSLVRAFVVPRRDVKTVKVKLEERGLLHKHMKITPWEDVNFMLIPTILRPSRRDASIGDDRLKAEDEAYLKELQEMYTATTANSTTESLQQKRPTTKSSLYEAMTHALLEISEGTLSSISASREALLETLPTAYSIYAPMLLLPSTILERPAWRSLMEYSGRLLATSEQPRTKDSEVFFAKLARAMSTTHVAVNAPIPTDTDTDAYVPKDCEAFKSSNVLRSPTNLVVLHGSFGPLLQPFPHDIPTTTDFEQAFWVSTTQNGIKQTWAPRYTMFSKGNVTEKARLLSLESVTSLSHEAWTAVDLFAGIGYFAFSYARAGASRVLCWDLNPWSTEGLRRGAALNKWGAVNVVAPNGTTVDERGVKSGAKLLIYCESNALAQARVEELRASVPPVRHVNCGMLPSAGQAWRTAVKCLDWQTGGWLHLHETVKESRVGERAEEIRQAVQGLLHELQNNDKEGARKVASIEHVERVKSVGPRMLHIVVDVRVHLL